MTPRRDRLRRYWSATNWMGGLALLLFWMPFAGPLIAGLVGGWKARSVGLAIAAVFLPAILTGLLAAAAVAYLADFYPWGLLAGLGATAVTLYNVVPLLLGAILGGAAGGMARRRGDAATPP